MSRADVLIAAIAKNKAYLAAKGALAYHNKIQAYQAELDELAADDTVTDGLFLVAENADEVYATGGTAAGNANGVTFTYGDARKWWEAVFEGGLNIGKVRSTLTPGSVVLSSEGYKAAVELGKTSTVYAAEDYNPLNLTVVP